MSIRCPDGVHAAPQGRALSEMLIAGELDALYSPPRPRRYHPVDGPIVRLFPDIRSIERQYFRATRMFPPQHLIVLRREAWQQNKWIARALTDTFSRCTEEFGRAQRSFPYASPWMDAELEEVEALMGADFHADGYERNRATVEVFAGQAHLAGIVERRHQRGGIFRRVSRILTPRSVAPSFPLHRHPGPAVPLSPAKAGTQPAGSPLSRG